MQLKFNKSISKRVITIELETVNFTSSENKMLDRFGEPRLVINKKYRGMFPVNIDRSIRTGFKVRVKFDGRENSIVEAVGAAEEFYTEVKEELSLMMMELVDKEFEVMFENKSGLDIINY